MSYIIFCDAVVKVSFPVLLQPPKAEVAVVAPAVNHVATPREGDIETIVLHKVCAERTCVCVNVCTDVFV